MMLIPLVTLAVTGYYTYFGQMVPQKEVHPPKTVEVSGDMTSQQLAELGKKIFEGKGTCTACHKMSGGSGRFPDVGNVGGLAGSRNPGMTDIEYLAESLYDPNGFILEGFNPGMPEVSKPPIDLTDDEIKAVIAYLQSLGGTPTITMATKLKWEE
jgi:cytochrome c oxidase subunit II